MIYEKPPNDQLKSFSIIRKAVADIDESMLKLAKSILLFYIFILSIYTLEPKFWYSMKKKTEVH